MVAIDPQGLVRVVTAAGPDGRSTFASVGPPPDLRVLGSVAEWHAWVWESETGPGPDALTHPERVRTPDTPGTVVPPRGGFAFKLVQIAPGQPADVEAYRSERRKLNLDSVPDTAAGSHTTPTLDLMILVTGELTAIVDTGEEYTLKPGDTVVQRGTNHRWENRGDHPALTAWFLVDARPRLSDDIG